MYPKDLQAAKVQLKAIGMTINKNRYDEYRVNFAQGGTEGTAYYTNDLIDAVQTGIIMQANRK